MSRKNKNIQIQTNRNEKENYAYLLIVIELCAKWEDQDLATVNKSTLFEVKFVSTDRC